MPDIEIMAKYHLEHKRDEKKKNHGSALEGQNRLMKRR
jgi:hypothetical protein